jgi:hypothetical protein
VRPETVLGTLRQDYALLQLLRTRSVVLGFSVVLVR